MQFERDQTAIVMEMVECKHCTQDLARVGAQCWVLHPSGGIRPVAEGVAGDAPPPTRAEGGIGRTLMMALCEEGQQTVKVTKVHKKNTELMFPDASAGSKFLDDYVDPPDAPGNTFVTWLSRYLVEKDDDAWRSKEGYNAYVVHEV